MKKIFTLITLLFTAAQSFGQFFYYTPYVGAFGAAGSSDWTAGWCNWDPENTTYPATNVTVNADITSNTTWSSGQVISLVNKVYVTNNAILTIEPGVVIRGDKATEGTLIITKGAKIMAQGTSSNPIVFTSGFDVADGRAPGDWGGVIILGNAVQNQGSSVVEGGLDAIKAAYGGTNDADNSGVFSYVRIEFAGFPFQPDKEINGLTLGAVGSGTKIDHIQCSFINDDSFEFFGGKVNASHLVSFRTVDDDFDTDFGYSGNIQFGLIVRDPDLSDQSSSSTSEGFESDNDGSGTAATPQTSAVFSNITLIGPYRGNLGTLPASADHKRALRIRRNSSISVFNSIFTDFPTGLMIDGTASETNATNGTLKFKNNVLAGMQNNGAVAAGSTFDINAFLSSNNNVTLAAASSVSFVNPYPLDFLGADYRLQAGSAQLTASDFTDTKFGTLLYQGIHNLSSAAGLMVYPSPAQNNLQLVTLQRANDRGMLSISDLSGKEVLSENFSVNAGNNLHTLDISALVPGYYMLSVTTASGRQIVSFIKN